MSKGHIEFFNPRRAYGFIREENETQNLFFHITNVIAGVPAIGRAVLFEKGETSRGPVAIDVRVIMGAERE